MERDSAGKIVSDPWVDGWTREDIETCVEQLWCKEGGHPIPIGDLFVMLDNGPSCVECLDIDLMAGYFGEDA